jgi:hypothetical protein
MKNGDLLNEEINQIRKMMGLSLNENNNMINPSYTHFAIFKTDGKIATGWDYSSLYDKYEKAYDDDSIKEYAREDIMNDFPENKISDFKLVTRKYLDKKNINPSDTNNWYKSSVNQM